MLTRIDEVWTRGSYICFRNLGKMNGRRGIKVTNTYEVLAVASRLGFIEWYARWRKYCFSPGSETVYEETCLREIAEFCEQETKQHRALRGAQRRAKEWEATCAMRRAKP